jgi:hypothetical protein
MTVRLVDPTIPPPGGGKPLATRLGTLEGATVGLVNNGKTWGREILQRISSNLSDQRGTSGAIAVTKQYVSFPADPADVDRLTAGATAIIAAIGD